MKKLNTNYSKYNNDIHNLFTSITKERDMTMQEIADLLPIITISNEDSDLLLNKLKTIINNYLDFICNEHDQLAIRET